MAKLKDTVEQFIDESMVFVFERLADTTELRQRGYLTVAQCALLPPAVRASEIAGNPSQMAAHWLMLAQFDIAHGSLCAKHPESLLPYNEYKEMARAGMFGVDGDEMPLPTAGWLVSVDEAQRWLSSKGFCINLSAIRARGVVLDSAQESASDVGTNTEARIPGKVPTTANGRLAIEAAWGIERDLGRRATAVEVMDLLREWASTGARSDILAGPGKDGRSVEWITDKSKLKIYHRDALAKTLSSWQKSCEDADAG